MARTHLNLAIASHDKTVDLVALIGKYTDVNSPDGYGNTPLHAAIQNGCALNVIKALVAKGANVEAQDNVLCTPLHVAFYLVAEKSVILYLLSYIKNVNITDVWKRTLLHLAIKTGRDHVIRRALTKNGANLEDLCKRWGSPALSALSSIPKHQSNYLIHNFRTVTRSVTSTESKLKRALLHAAGVERECAPEVIRILYEKGADLDAQDGQGRTPLHTAFSYCCPPYYQYTRNQQDIIVEIYSFLIKNTSHINGLDNYNRPPLYYAFFQCHPPVFIRALIENGADFNCPDSSVFRLAVKERLPLLTETFPDELNYLRSIILSRRTTLYDALVLDRPHDWNRVDRPLECLTESNKPFWSVIMSSIVAQRSFSLRLHSQGVRLDEDSTLHVISFLQNCDVINLLLAYRHCLYLKTRSDSPLTPTIKRRKVL